MSPPTAIVCEGHSLSPSQGQHWRTVIWVPGVWLGHFASHEAHLQSQSALGLLVPQHPVEPSAAAV